jgi:hypothetical protein
MDVMVSSWSPLRSTSLERQNGVEKQELLSGFEVALGILGSSQIHVEDGESARRQ